MLSFTSLFFNISLLQSSNLAMSLVQHVPMRESYNKWSQQFLSGIWQETVDQNACECLVHNKIAIRNVRERDNDPEDLPLLK